MSEETSRQKLMLTALEKLLTPGSYLGTTEIAVLLGVSRGNVVRWLEARGLLPDQRTVGGHRRYLSQKILKLVKEESDE